MKKQRIGIFYGGPSSERDVSISTAKQILNNIDQNLFVPITIKVDKHGVWPEDAQLIKSKIDFAFIAMHGAYGEDGEIQEILEELSLPYSGSGVKASRLAMDKYQTGLLAEKIGISCPRTWLIGFTKIALTELNQKLIIKPNSSGSSEGVEFVSKSDLETNLDRFIQLNQGTLLQNYISGREFTVSILGSNPLPVIEIISKNTLYDYDAKYTLGQSKHIIPAELPDDIYQDIQNKALMIHRALGCKVMSRSDFLLKQGKLYYLETNTIPGMTPTSLFPEAAQYTGINFTDLITQIIELSLKHDI